VGGSDDAEAVKTIRTALDLGITLIDTAPAYGFGRSEELVGQAIAEHGGRERVLIATKAGLGWRAGAVYRDASAERIRTEIEDSLRRLERATSTSIRCTGPIRSFPWRRRRRCCAASSSAGRSARSA